MIRPFGDDFLKYGHHFQLFVDIKLTIGIIGAPYHQHGGLPNHHGFLSKMWTSCPHPLEIPAILLGFNLWGGWCQQNGTGKAEHCWNPAGTSWNTWLEHLGFFLHSFLVCLMCRVVMLEVLNFSGTYVKTTSGYFWLFFRFCFLSFFF